VQYCLQVLPGRLAKSKALKDVNHIKIMLKDRELDQEKITFKKGASVEDKEVRV
jgi:hypothetical protein